MTNLTARKHGNTGLLLYYYWECKILWTHWKSGNFWKTKLNQYTHSKFDLFYPRGMKIYKSSLRNLNKNIYSSFSNNVWEWEAAYISFSGCVWLNRLVHRRILLSNKKEWATCSNLESIMLNKRSIPNGVWVQFHTILEKTKWLKTDERLIFSKY